MNLQEVKDWLEEHNFNKELTNILNICVSNLKSNSTTDEVKVILDNFNKEILKIYQERDIKQIIE